MEKSLKNLWAKCIGCECTDDAACEVPHRPEGVCSWIAVDYKVHIGVCSECEDYLKDFNEAHRASINARDNHKGGLDETDQG